MKTQYPLVLAAVVIIVATLTSCRTVRGFGRDVQHVGAKIESKATRLSPY